MLKYLQKSFMIFKIKYILFINQQHPLSLALFSFAFPAVKTVLFISYLGYNAGFFTIFFIIYAVNF